ncbi:MAG: hypothetical protein ACK40V_06885 [Anaerolineales bacterium]
MAKKNKRPAQVMANNPPQKFEFNPDYSMVKKDLKRIGILAGFFITIFWHKKRCTLFGLQTLPLR